MIDRKELKAEAREAIRATKPSPVLVTLAVAAILLVTHALSLSLSGDLKAYRTMAEEYILNGRFVYVEPTGSAGALPWLLTLGLDLMSLVIGVGYTLYCMRVIRRQSPSFGDVFDVFGLFLRAVALSLLRSIVVSLASFIYAVPAAMLGMVIGPVTATVVCLPLLAPMFILAYSYRLAAYILLDDPAYPAIQCLMLSRAAMKGRKKELFLLDLSFLGWMLLCLFPPAILWVRPYMDVTCAGWYDRVMPGFTEELKRRAAEPRPDPGPSPWQIPGEPRNDEDDGEDR